MHFCFTNGTKMHKTQQLKKNVLITYLGPTSGRLPALDTPLCRLKRKILVCFRCCYFNFVILRLISLYEIDNVKSNFYSLLAAKKQTKSLEIHIWIQYQQKLSNYGSISNSNLETHSTKVTTVKLRLYSCTC